MEYKWCTLTFVKLVKVLLFVMLFETRMATSDECYNTPCVLDEGTCFTSGCKRAGLQTVCTLTSTSNKSKSTDAECMIPSQVPGFTEFCLNLLEDVNMDSAPGPGNFHNGNDCDARGYPTTSDYQSTLAPTKDEKILELSPGETCFGATILVSVAVGSFVAGVAVTLIILCCCRIFTPCTRKSEHDGSFDSEARDVWHTQRLGSRDLGSTSTAQLLPNAALDNSPIHANLPPTPELPDQGIAPWSRERPVVGFSSRSYQLGNRARFNGVPPVMETIYTAASESSSRDYQSIQGGSENPYTVNSESGSDYFVSGNMTATGGGLGGADYMSLKGQGYCKDEGAIYYPTSEASNKDYSSLAGEREENNYIEPTGGLINPNIDIFQRTRDSVTSSENVKFHVNGLDFPTKQVLNIKRERDLNNINEYETLDGEPTAPRDVLSLVNLRGSSQRHVGGNNGTIADSAMQTLPDTHPHEYFILEPMER